MITYHNPTPENNLGNFNNICTIVNQEVAAQRGSGAECIVDMCGLQKDTSDKVNDMSKNILEEVRHQQNDDSNKNVEVKAPRKYRKGSCCCSYKFLRFVGKIFACPFRLYKNVKEQPNEKMLGTYALAINATKNNFKPFDSNSGVMENVKIAEGNALQTVGHVAYAENISRTAGRTVGELYQENWKNKTMKEYCGVLLNGTPVVGSFMEGVHEGVEKEQKRKEV